jgi:hypothetical protein
MSDDEAVEAQRLRAPARFALSRVINVPVYLRRERRDGWHRPLPVYVRWCDGCGVHSVSHAAGYGRIHCRSCGDRARVLTWARVRDKPIGIALAFALAAASLLVVWLLTHR